MTHTFEGRSPTTGEPTGSYTVAAPQQIQAALERGRLAGARWGRLPVATRLEHLGRLRAALTDHLDEVLATLIAATGKPDVEALASDVLVCADLIYYYERHGAAFLATTPRRGHGIYRLSQFEVLYEPLGLVAVIGPWNHPLQLTLVPAVTALAAGNAVVVKPSEVTPSVGALIEDLARWAGLPEGLLQVLQGDGEVGQALIEAGPDAVFFTGSVATGRLVAQAAAQRLIPAILELGGKDPMIVFEDAHQERAVRGALYGAFSNAGQNCVAVERLYVQQPLYDRFVARLVEETAKLRVGGGIDADLGPIISPDQIAIIEDHVADALKRGASAAPTSALRREGNRLWPLILTNVDHRMKVMQEETFGPLLPVMPFADEDEAVALANDSAFGLNASVWTRDLERGRRVARRLICGACAVNDVLKNIGNPATPFGGAKQSGLGRYHGPEGLHALSRQKSIMVSRGALPREPNWFPYDKTVHAALRALIQTLYGGGSSVARTSKALSGFLGALLTNREDNHG